MKKLFAIVGLCFLMITGAYSYYMPPTLSAFNPTGQLTLAASTVSAAGALGSSGASSPVATTAVVQNLGSALAYVQLGASNVVATASSVPVQPTQTFVFSIRDATHAAAVTASGVTTVSVTTGF